MNLRNLTIACVLTVVFFSGIGLLSSSAHAVEPQNEIDENDVDVRENPVIEMNDEDFGIEVPEFINSELNHIELNGADWSSAANALKNSSRRAFTIVHIGDSHLQADIATATVRELLQYDYGNAGRGLVVPFKMAGTNQPSDYIMSSSDRWETSKILRRPWSLPMGISGISIRPAGGKGTLFVATREDDDYNPFVILNIFHTGPLKIDSVRDRDGKAVEYSVNYGKGLTTVTLKKEETGVSLDVDVPDGESAIHGIDLSGGRPGIFYHTIGNNGATYNSYANIDNLGQGVRQLSPNLIILSLGTNEAFGNFNAYGFKKSMKKVIDDIRKANPGIPILLVTPMECQKSSYTSSKRQVRKQVKGSGKRGKKFKYVSEPARIRNYVVNNTVAEVRDAILEFGRENHIATYDWYTVAGGDGASSLWISENLYGRDRVHHTSKGYRLQGFLLYNALKQTLVKP